MGRLHDRRNILKAMGGACAAAPWGWNTGDPGPIEIRNYDGAAIPDASQLHNEHVEPICRKYLELRYRMVPYLYSAVRECTTTGMPIIRALWLHYPDDPAAVACAEDMPEYDKTMRRAHQMQIAIARSMERMRRIDAQLEENEKMWRDADAVRLGKKTQEELADVRSDFVPPRYSPEHLNLMIRVNQLSEEIGNYSGRPTQAQEEYVGVFEGQVRGVMRRIEDIVSGDLKELNDRLAAARVPKISTESQLGPTE